MMVITLILIGAAVGLAAAKRWRLPSIPLLIIAGIALSAAGLLGDGEMTQNTLLLGVTFLVFVMGTELNPNRVGNQRREAFLIGMAQFVALGVVGVLVMRALGMGWSSALYVGLAMTASSTLVVVSLLRQRQQSFEPFGRLVLGVLLLQDMLIIFAIAGLNSLADGPIAVVRALVITAGLVLLAWICVRWVMPTLLARLSADEEGLLVAVLAVLFTFTGIAYWLDVSWVVGAFLAGVALSGFPTQAVVRSQLTSLSDFFTAVFFVSLGAILTLPTLREWLYVIVLVAMVLLVTPALVAIVGRRVGMTSRSSIESGLLIAQCSEFSLILALIGSNPEQAYLEEGMLGVIALVTVITMIATPFIATDAMTWRVMRWQLPGTTRKLRPRDFRGHILMLGCGTSGAKLLDRLLAHGQPVVVVDDDPAVVGQLQRRGVAAIRGDGADHQLLDSVNAHDASIIISNMRRLEDNLRMLRFVKGVQVLVRVFAPQSADRIRALGGTAIVDSEAAADGFLTWFDQRFKPRHEKSEAATPPTDA